MRIAVIIVHFGNRNDTLECLQSIAETKLKLYKLKIYLVDNDPKNRINRSELKQKVDIELIKTEKNKGWGAATNIACRKAIADKCDFILFLNNDTVVAPDLFKNLLPYFRASDVGMVSPIITYYDSPKLIWCGGAFLNEHFLYTTFRHMNKNIDSINIPRSIEADYGGTCLLVKISVFERIGFVNEKYFLNVEDVEWCFRARKAGFRLLYTGNSIVLHKVSANAGIWGSNMLSARNAYYYARNFFIFMRDDRGGLSLFYGLVGQIFIRLPFYTLFRTRSLEAFLSYLKGFFDGFLYLLTGKLLSYSLDPN